MKHICFIDSEKHVILRIWEKKNMSNTNQYIPRRVTLPIFFFSSSSYQWRVFNLYSSLPQTVSHLRFSVRTHTLLLLLNKSATKSREVKSKPSIYPSLPLKTLPSCTLQTSDGRYLMVTQAEQHAYRCFHEWLILSGYGYNIKQMVQPKGPKGEVWNSELWNEKRLLRHLLVCKG